MVATTESRAAQAAIEEASRVVAAADEGAIKVFDAWSRNYLAVLDSNLTFQTRAVETSKLLLDESIAFGRAQRKLAEELLDTVCQIQRALIETNKDNLRAMQEVWSPRTTQAFWMPPAKR